MANREAIVDQIREIAERVAASEGLEVVEVQLLGGGGQRVLRIFIDRIAPATGYLATTDSRAGETAAESPEESDPNTGTATATMPELGVSHADCEFISHEVGTILDIEDVIPGGHYTLEVSSPGVERKLSRPRDFERFLGHKVKIVLREPVEGQRHWSGQLAGFQQGTVILEPAPGRSLEFPLDQVEKANLKFEW